MAVKIILSKSIGKNIVLRSSISELFEEIEKLKSEEIFIDFQGIVFMSRSSAAEYLKLREESDKKLLEKNMSEEVKSMFKLVESQFRGVKFVFRKGTPTGKLAV